MLLVKFPDRESFPRATVLLLDEFDKKLILSSMLVRSMMSDRITWDVLKGFDLDHSIRKLEGLQEKYRSEMEGILKVVKLLPTSPMQENIVTLIEMIMKINISHGEENINLLEILNALKKGIENIETKIEEINDRINKIEILDEHR